MLNTDDEKLVFELSRPGRRAFSMPTLDVPAAPKEAIPKQLSRKKPPMLPEVAERDLVRHYTRLSQRNYGIDLGFYPLGSCSMKYNPKLAEDVAAMPGFRRLHPLQPESQIQGALRLLVELEQALCAVTGMEAVTFQPAAGAHGELTGLLIMRAFHEHNNDQRKRVIIPDSAHGTNPASVRLAGYEVSEVASDRRGLVDLDALEKLIGPDVAGLMITNPNTLGLFEENIERIAKMIHSVGGLLYYDGANLNAIVGRCRPGDMGFDIVHMNLHKTFATPHGGGGPGAGPLSVSARLAPFLPSPRPAFDASSGRYVWAEGDGRSIGRVHSFHGNFGILARASSYVRALGADGLRHVSDYAVLNANYLSAKLTDAYELAFPDSQPMHEFVLTARKQKARGARAMDVAKRIIDYGFHPPTVYFPLVVDEAMMVEPTETESIETLDAFSDAMHTVDREIDENPHALHEAPLTAPVSRPDEARAARDLRARWHPNHHADAHQASLQGPEDKPSI
ncbi:MAG TPA: aminomethyl-transferring glycine dehydrogenase subunit GcvPB [Actinomycetota bacterium]|nr:aminomethyl-transferring glycine dehydrogenase subunit GcvPB [Actinomycetota bacterium]